jgi:hypothetical protein
MSRNLFPAQNSSPRYNQAAMTKDDHPRAEENLRSEIEQFIRSVERPALVEDEIELFDLSSARWRVSVEFGKLFFEVWNQTRSIARRVEGIAYRDSGRLGLFVRKPHARHTSTIEIRQNVDGPDRKSRTRDRAGFRRELVAMLGREYRGWKFELVSSASDREHSFSAWYTRGLARRGRQGWAFLGLGAAEPFAAADSILAFALLWLDSLRKRSARVVVPGLKMFLPRQAIEFNAGRIESLNSRALQLEIFDWQPGDGIPRPIELSPQPTMDARLLPYAQGLRLLERHDALLKHLLGDLVGKVAIVPDSAERSLSIRVAGLELARVEGDLAPRVLFGLEGRVRQLDATNPDDFRKFFKLAIEKRCADSSDTSHELFRLQSERWLESVVVRDTSRLDPALQPEYAYSQVPAFSNVSRGVIDVLGIRAGGRLAVIELKLHEEINLPFQALDYWIAVKDLAERGQFQKYGYFPDIEIATAPPLLYLVAPAFRFHSSTNQILRYLDPSIEILQVGINDAWRKGLKVLFRHERSLRR